MEGGKAMKTTRYGVLVLVVGVCAGDGVMDFAGPFFGGLLSCFGRLRVV